MLRWQQRCGGGHLERCFINVAAEVGCVGRVYSFSEVVARVRGSLVEAVEGSSGEGGA